MILIPSITPILCSSCKCNTSNFFYFYNQYNYLLQATLVNDKYTWYQSLYEKTGDLSNLSEHEFNSVLCKDCLIIKNIIE